MTVIAVFNQKGGVGKTTTALNLLAGIAQRKQRPLGIDLDPQAHLSGIFGIRPRLADESVYSFFMRQRPLGDVSQITDSGVILCPGHLELTKPRHLARQGRERRHATARRAQGARYRSGLGGDRLLPAARYPVAQRHLCLRPDRHPGLWPTTSRFRVRSR